MNRRLDSSHRRAAFDPARLNVEGFTSTSSSGPDLLENGAAHDRRPRFFPFDPPVISCFSERASGRVPEAPSPSRTIRPSGGAPGVRRAGPRRHRAAAHRRARRRRKVRSRKRREWCLSIASLVPAAPPRLLGLANAGVGSFRALDITRGERNRRCSAIATARAPLVSAKVARRPVNAARAADRESTRSPTASARHPTSCPAPRERLVARRSPMRPAAWRQPDLELFGGRASARNERVAVGSPDRRHAEGPRVRGFLRHTPSIATSPFGRSSSPGAMRACPRDAKPIDQIPCCRRSRAPLSRSPAKTALGGRRAVDQQYERSTRSSSLARHGPGLIGRLGRGRPTGPPALVSRIISSLAEACRSPTSGGGSGIVGTGPARSGWTRSPNRPVFALGTCSDAQRSAVTSRRRHVSIRPSREDRLRRPPLANGHPARPASTYPVASRPPRRGGSGTLVGGTSCGARQHANRSTPSPEVL